jgi:molybdate transport system substrate-binding protein
MTPRQQRVRSTRHSAVGSWVLVAFLAFGCNAERPQAPAPPIRIAAAADLSLAFEALGSAFERETGQRVSFSFGSTGLLAKQIREGAPFDLFAAANVSFVEEVVQAGACDASTQAPYARGRIALWTKRLALDPPSGLSDLADARFRRIAIANPEHAPYGQAAKQALERAGSWDAVKTRLVYGENVRQTLQFAETGNVEAAIVALALVVNDRENPWALIDEALHRPIDQALVVCARGSQRAGGEAFARFAGSEPGRAVMRRYGFLLPGEALAKDP